MMDIWDKILCDDDVRIAEHERAFFQRFLKIAKFSKKILEIGAGKGRMIKVLRSYGVESEIVCLDINKFISNCRKICSPILGDARYLPFKDETFDLVYSLGVIEHFPETEYAVREHVRVLKKGGYLLITTPHLSVYTPLRYLFWFFRYRNLGSFEEVMGRNLSLRYLKRVVSSYNMDILDCGVSGVFAPKPIFKKCFKIIPEKFFGAYLWILCKKI